MTSRLIAQMKADSSRATAVAATVGSLPLRRSERKRPHNRVCAFHAISRTRLGAAATFGCFREPHGDCRILIVPFAPSLGTMTLRILSLGD